MTLARVYPRDVDAETAFERELTDLDYGERLAAHNRFNERIFAASQAAAAARNGMALALTNDPRHGASGEPIFALRAGTFSPLMGEADVQAIVEQLLKD